VAPKKSGKEIAPSRRRSESRQSPSPGADPGALTVGRRVRHLRHSKQMKLAELAKAAGCSTSLLSRVENEIVEPSLSTLHRLCRALGISVSALFSDEIDNYCVVYAPGERPKYNLSGTAEGDGSRAESIVPYAGSRLLEGFIIDLPPDSPSCGPFKHEGEEAGYVISGELELVVNGKSYVVRRGGSFFFRSDIVHTYRAAGAKLCRVVWINTPPSF
jgi:transcriptional regulator with XRE-family HTH domain